MFANPVAFGLINHFQVDHNSGMHVHDILQLWLHTPRRGPSALLAVRPSSLDCLVCAYMDKTYPPPLCPQFTKATTTPAQESTNPGQAHTRDVDAAFAHLGARAAWAKSKCDWANLYGNQEGGEKQSERLQRRYFTADQIGETKALVHAEMDLQMQKRLVHLERFHAAGDVEAMLKTWTCAVEEGVIAATCSVGEGARRSRGRSQVVLRQVEANSTGRYDKATQRLQVGSPSSGTSRVEKQRRRLKAIKDTLLLLGRVTGEPPPPHHQSPMAHTSVHTPLTLP